MTFSFRPAVRENVGLLIGLAGSSGSGKTFTALRLAKGMSGGRPFCVIDTEAGRAKHYADIFKFDHGDLRPPFSPANYSEAIAAADAAGYPVIVVDSCSHEHSGTGGLLDMQEAEFVRMGSKESAKMASWVKPKGEHRKFSSKLLQVRAHLILCFRASEKIEMVRVDGKMEVRKKQTATGLDGWVPDCEKTLPYELTASFLLMASAPGIPHPIKLQEQHKALFPLDKPITEESGQRLAQWAAGATKQPAESLPVNQKATVTQPAGEQASPKGLIDNALASGETGLAAVTTLSKQQKGEIESLCEMAGININRLLVASKVSSLDEIPEAHFNRCLEWIDRASKKEKA